MATYYINGTTLSNSTAVFIDSSMNTCAADGFYSDGNITREQVSCSLLPPIECPSCNFACGSSSISLTLSTTDSLARLTADTGTDVGAILIYFKSNSVPEGIRVEQNNVYYNKLTAESGGTVLYAASANATNGFTYTGATGSTGTCDANFGVSIIDVTSPNYDYTGGVFLTTGGSTTLQIQPTDVVLDSYTGFYMMVVPKTIAVSNILDVEIHAPCGSTNWTLFVKCPVLLTAVPAALGTDCTTTTFPLSYYNAPLDETSFGEPDIGDFIFTDAYGETTVAAGNYIINPSSAKKQMVVDANGVITSLTNCP